MRSNNTSKVHNILKKKERTSTCSLLLLLQSSTVVTHVHEKNILKLYGK